MNELKAILFKNNLGELISNSELPVSLAYYIMKETTEVLKKTYEEVAESQRQALLEKENESEANEQDDN